MRTEYLYANERENEKYIVFKVGVKNDYFLAERKVRTFAKQLNLTLAGGSFSTPPYDFKDNYICYEVPKNTKPQRPTAKDRFIFDLIEFESNGLPRSREFKFLKKAKRMGLSLRLGGLR